MSLAHFITKINTRRELFELPPLTEPLDEAGKAEVRIQLMTETSPENISCDGGLTRTMVARRVAYYNRVENDLNA
jgi:hypothetical protein